MTSLAVSLKENLEVDEVTPPFIAVGELSGEGLNLRLTQKYYYSSARVPGYDFKLLVDGEDVGTVSALIAKNHDLVREVGNIGVEIKRKFHEKNLPLNATKVLLPFFQGHGMLSILITCDKGNAAVRKACEELTAGYLDTIDTAQGNLKKDRFKFYL